MVALVLSLATGAAWAAGSHSSGHGHHMFGKPGKAEDVTRTIEVSLLIRVSTDLHPVEEGIEGEGVGDRVGTELIAIHPVE